MQFMYASAKHKSPAGLSNEALDKILSGSIKSVAVYSSVQFLDHAKIIMAQLEKNGIKAATSKPKRAHLQGQILGCDCFEDSLGIQDKFDAFLYIGDGMFHPNALLLGQKSIPKDKLKAVYCYDPLTGFLRSLKQDEVKNVLVRYQQALKSFLVSRAIGVLISTKPGQQQFRAAKELSKVHPQKDYYYFLADSISFDELQNFPYIGSWVNTACPRIGFDDAASAGISMINLKDALSAQETLDKLKQAN